MINRQTITIDNSLAGLSQITLPGFAGYNVIVSRRGIGDLDETEIEMLPQGGFRLINGSVFALNEKFTVTRDLAVISDYQITNKEALQGELQNIVATDLAVEKALIDQGLTGSDPYDPVNAKSIAICTINVLQSILTSQDIKEGGFSVSQNYSNVQLRIKAIANRWGLSEYLFSFTPSIRSVARW